MLSPVGLGATGHCFPRIVVPEMLAFIFLVLYFMFPDSSNVHYRYFMSTVELSHCADSCKKSGVGCNLKGKSCCDDLTCALETSVSDLKELTCGKV